MKDRLLLGLALFFLLGFFLFAQGAYGQYYDICKGDLNPSTKPVYCDPFAFYEIVGFSLFPLVAAILLLWVWSASRKLEELVT